MSDLLRKYSAFHSFFAIWLGEVFDALDSTVYFMVMVPALGDLLHTSDYVQIGICGTFILACFLFGWALGCVIFGALADRYGRINALTYSLLLYALASGLCAFSHNWIELAIYRFFVGLGIGGEINVGVVYLSEHWHPKSKNWAISLSQTSFPAGMLLVSVITSSLGSYGWRALFLVGVIPALLTFYIRRFLSEAKSNHTEISSSANPLSDLPGSKTLFKSGNYKKLLLAGALAICTVVGYWGAIAWTPSFIDQITHTNAIVEKSGTNFWTSIGGIIGCFGAPFLIRFCGISNALKISFLGTLIFAASMFLLFKTYSSWMLMLCCMEGFFGIQTFNVLAIWVLSLFDKSVCGTASGIIWCSGRIAGAITILCSAQLLAFLHGSYALFACSIAAVCYFFGILLCGFIKHSNKSSDNKQIDTYQLQEV